MEWVQSLSQSLNILHVIIAAHSDALNDPKSETSAALLSNQSCDCASPTWQEDSEIV